MDTFNNLSTPVKAGVALASGAGLVGTIALLTGGNGTVLLIMAMGIVLVGVLLVAYKFVLGWLGKRKAAPLERGILNNSAASPNSISEPARRARLDDLRRSFENGVEKFRASGKNIYSLPWYALVGEPGSGKTEAIRHCNVGFPPGLQDQLQGAGGTLNMNWWFTNHAIILDTAGRLMFEEVEPGATSEWKEFLTLLTRVRPNCPINGMLLVIPADSLIRDTADSIERKAGKIAQQLDSIQRLLGVRFPVFIVITKADLINGFREFFDTLADPQLQHQIMGWSNPAPLDQPFSPDLVEKHLQTVAASLSKRRQGLLIDPVNTEDPNGRRVDQVDALYAFPESLLKIGPRLRRYLEMVFVAGEWSPKPLFLRGIYFTSSMREGSALDAELAEALKVPIESLPEGKVWERDRAYFLRDLFLQKVFKEKGLVTRASDTKKLQRRRKMAVMVAGFIGVFLLLGLTWYGARTLDKSIGDQKEYWSAASSEYADSSDKWALFDTKAKPAKYMGDDKIRVAAGKIERAKFHADTYDMLQNKIYVPLIFRPLSALSGNLNEKRSTAYRAMFEVSVLQPLVKAARDKISAETPATWNGRATQALAQLVRIETYAANGTPMAAAEPPMNLDPLARYVLEKDEDYTAFRTKHEKGLQSSVEWLYTTKDGGGKWLPPGLTGNLPVASKGIDTFNQYWAAQVSDKSPRFQQVNALIDALRRFKTAEGTVASAVQNPADSADQYRSFSENWARGFSELTAGKDAADRAIEALSKDNKWPDGTTLASVVAAELSAIANDANRDYQVLAAHLPADEKTGATSPAAKLRADLKDAQARFASASSALINDQQRSKAIAELDQIYLPKGKDIDKNQSRRYVIHYQAYSRANEQVKPGNAAASSFSTIAADLKKIDSDMDAKLMNDVKALLSGFTTDQPPIKAACDTALAVGDIAAKQKRYELLSLTLKTAPQNSDQVAAAIAAEAAKLEQVTHRKVSLTTFDKDEKFSPDYHPDAAKEYISGWKAVGAQLADAKAKPRSGVLNAAELSTAYDATTKPINDYLKKFTNYWTEDLKDSLKVAEFPSWSGIFSGELKGGQWEVKAIANLWAIDDASRKALNMVLSPQAVQALNLPPPMTERDYGLLQERTVKCVSYWRALGDDAEKARNDVLAMQQVDFESRYLFPEDDRARLAERYVFQFSLRMLEALANDSRKTARDSLAKLRQLSRFPLARPEKNQPTLTEKEVAEARTLYNKIKMGDVNVAAARPVAVRDVSPVESLLRTLRQLDMNRDDTEFIRRTGLLLKALPELGKPLTCTVSWLPTTKQKQYGSQANKKVPVESYPYGELIQSVEVPSGKWPNDRSLTDNAKSSTIGTVTCPGDPIRFRLSQFSSFSKDDKLYVWPDVAAKEYDATTPYTCLRLLHQDNVFYRSDDGLIWHVEVPVDAGNSFWIELKFEAKVGFPDLKEWPEKPQTPRP